MRTELTAVIARWHGRMVAAAARILKDEHEAEDAVQDAYLQAIRHLDQFDCRARLSTWLHRVVVNAALMRLRARQRRPIERLNAVALVDEAAAVESVVERRQMQAMVRRALGDVSSVHRQVLVRCHLEEEDAAQVARGLGITSGALKSRAHRARAALRERLVRIGGEAATPAASGASAAVGDRSAA